MTDFVMQLNGSGALSRQLELLKDLQSESQTGCWEREENETQSFWSDSMFLLHALPILPGNLVSSETAANFIHSSDLKYFHLKRVELAKFGYVDFSFRIITQNGDEKRIHAREKSIEADDLLLFRGFWQEDVLTGTPPPDHLVKTLRHTPPAPEFTSRPTESVQQETSNTAGRVQRLLTEGEELAQLGSWEYNVAEDKLYWSDGLFHIYGYAAQAFQPTVSFLISTIHMDDRQQLESAIKLAKTRQVPFSFEQKILALDGRLIHVKIASRIQLDVDGKTSSIFCSVLDITSQHVSEAQILRNAERMRKQYVLDRQAETIRKVGTWQLNITSGRMIWGENLFRLLGYMPFQFRPNLESFLNAIHPDDLQRVRHSFEEAIRLTAGLVPNFEFRILDNGEVKFLRTSCKLFASGPQRTMIGTVQDVTEDVLLRRELAERIQFAEILIDSSVDRILSIDQSMKIITWNSKCQVYYGLSAHEVIGKSLLEILPSMKEDDDLMNALNRAMKGETVHLPPKESAQGKEFTESFFIPLYHSEGGMYGLLNILHDVTDKIETQKELQSLNRSLVQNNKELQEMNDELSSFAFVASHDLREPLRKVQVFSKLIAERDAANLSEKSIDYFTRMQAAVKRMDQLIDDILNFSRISSSKGQSTSIDLNQLLKTVAVDMSRLISKSGANIKAGVLPHVIGNSSHFYVLFQNLISNAIKYQPQGNLAVVTITSTNVYGSEIDNSYAPPDLEYHRVTVSDNGIGFEDQYAKKIFQMFQRLHGMHEYPGTGMGLAICKKIVEHHEGFIIASSHPGEGSSFHCYFPVTVFEVAPPPVL